jgi:hypothetical protein
MLNEFNTETTRKDSRGSGGVREGSVHLEGLPRGIYIFKAVSGTQVHVARFVRL